MPRKALRTRHSALSTRHCIFGFTLIELVAIIAIAGILAAITAPRFFNAAGYDARGYVDKAAGFLRYAQKLAIARHNSVTVQIASSGLSLCATPACTDAHPWPGPQGETPYRAAVPSGVTLAGSAGSIGFDDNGIPSTGVTLSITGETARTLTVEAGTGYVH